MSPSKKGRAVRAVEWRNGGKDLQITYEDDGSIWLYKNVTIETVIHEDVQFSTDSPIRILPLDFVALPPFDLDAKEFVR